MQLKLKQMNLNYEEYYILKTYKIFLDERIDTKKLNDAYNHLREKKKIPFKKILQSIINNIKMGLKDYWYLNIPIWGLIFCIIFIKPKKGILALSLEAIREAIYIFLLFEGRLPDRVYRATAFITLLTLVAMIINLSFEKKMKRIIVALVCCVLVICSADAIYEQIKHRDAMISSYDQINQRVYNYCDKHPNTIFFISMRTNQYVFKQNNIKNACLLEQFLTRSELMNRYTKDLNSIDISETMCKNYRYKLIIDDKDYNELQDYYFSRFKGRKLIKKDIININENTQYDVLELH